MLPGLFQQGAATVRLREKYMKHLKLIAKDIDVRPLVEEIESNSELWYADTSRQDKIQVQRETLAIALRCHGETAGEDSRAGSDLHEV